MENTDTESSLQKMLIDAVFESERQDIVYGPTLVKAYAILAEKVISQKNFIDILAEKNPIKILDTIEDKWEIVEEQRQNNKDAYEELLPHLDEGKVTKDVLSLVSEGRISYKSVVDIQRKLQHNEHEQSAWKSETLQEIKEAEKVRMAEKHSGLLPVNEHKR